MKAVLASLLVAASAFAEIRTETVTVTMRDGIRLTADVYRDDAVPQAPVILMRTPYDRTKAKGTGLKFAKAGYVAVMQDCRGTRASEGVMAPYNNEGQDGYDTIEWITRQPWCSGRVGMHGGSYVGAVQWQAAAEHPPGLAAIAPQRVDSLVLVNPLGLWLDDVGGADPFAQHPGMPSEVLFSQSGMRKQFLFDGRDKMDAHVEELLNLRASAKFLWPIPDTGVLRRLPRIVAPTLIATSNKDAVVPAAYGPAWRDAIAGSRLTTIPNAGHLAELEQPEAFAALARDFIRAHAMPAVA